MVSAGASNCSEFSVVDQLPAGLSRLSTLLRAFRRGENIPEIGRRPASTLVGFDRTIDGRHRLRHHQRPGTPGLEASFITTRPRRCSRAKPRWKCPRTNRLGPHGASDPHSCMRRIQPVFSYRNSSAKLPEKHVGTLSQHTVLVSKRKPRISSSQPEQR